MQYLNVTLTLQSFIEKEKWMEIKKNIPIICKGIRNNKESFSVPLLRGMLSVLLKFDFFGALESAVEIFQSFKENDIGTLSNVIQLILFPTIFENVDLMADIDKPSFPIDKKADRSTTLTRLVGAIVEKKFLIAQIQFLHKFYGLLWAGEDITEMYEQFTEENKIVLAANVSRIYLGNLLQQEKKNYSSFFKVWWNLTKESKGYHFEIVLHKLLERACTVLEEDLRNIASPDFVEPWQTDQYAQAIKVIISVVNAHKEIPSLVVDCCNRCIDQICSDLKSSLSQLRTVSASQLKQ